jgi:uncharacterized OB-fold protein
MTVPIPHPAPDEDTGPFWAGCRERTLLLQRCADCGTWRFPPRPRCPSCSSTETTWERASGQGLVASYTICHPPVLPAFADRAPYNVVVVQLDEGPFLVSNLLEGQPEMGLAVRVTFADVDDELTLPQFRPLAGDTLRGSSA